MIINKGIFFGKSKKKDNKSNKSAAPQKKPKLTAFGTMTEADFYKIASTMSNIANDVVSTAKKYNYSAECDYYGDDMSVNQYIQMMKKDFNSGDTTAIAIDLVMYNNGDDLSEADREKFIKDMNNLAKKYGYIIDFSKMNEKIASKKNPDLFISAYCDNWSNPYFQIYAKEENYKKSESTNESASYLNKVIFESANI